jgi:hypothetical protein
MIHYYKLEGTKAIRVPFSEWTKEKENTIVKQDYIGDIFISTIFTGMDFIGNEEDPILFETMIYGGAQDLYQRRYSTWEEAVEGHQLAIDIIRSEHHEES